MTETQAQSVLKRMAKGAEDAPVEVPLTVTRALRLAATRAADRSIALALSVTKVTEESCELDDLLAQLDDSLVMMGLTDANGEVQRGLIACCHGLAAAASEVQTFGEVDAENPEPRTLSSADVALLRPYLEAVVDELQLTTQHTVLDGWAAGVTVGDRFLRARSVGFALSDMVYRHVRVALDLNGEGRAATLIVALPLDSQPVLSTAGEPRGAVDWTPAFQAAVKAAPLRLDAVLHRFEMSLATAADLHPGQVIPLRGGSIGNVRLEDLDGNVVVRGRLGQLAGFVAVRVEQPDLPQLQDFSGDAAPALPPAGGMAELGGGMELDGLGDGADDAGLDLGMMGGGLEAGGGLELPGDEGGLPDLPLGDAPGLDGAGDLELPMAEPAGLELPVDDGPDLDLPMGEGLAPLNMAGGLDLPLDEDA